MRNATTTQTTQTTGWNTSDLARWNALRQAFERGILFRGDIGETVRPERDVIVTAINRAIVALEQGSFKRGGYRDTELKVKDGDMETRRVKTRHGNSVKHDFKPNNDKVPRDRTLRERILGRYLERVEYDALYSAVCDSPDNGKSVFARLSMRDTIYAREIYSGTIAALYVALFGTQSYIDKNGETKETGGLFHQGSMEETAPDGSVVVKYPYFHGRGKKWSVRHDAASFSEMILRAASRCALREIITRTSTNARTGRISTREVKHLMREGGYVSENQVRQEIIWRDYLKTVQDRPTGIDCSTWQGIIKSAMKRAESNSQGLVLNLIRFHRDGMRTVQEFIREKHPLCDATTVYRKARIAEQYIVEAAEREGIIRNTFDRHGSGDYGNSPQHVRQNPDSAPDNIGATIVRNEFWPWEVSSLMVDHSPIQTTQRKPERVIVNPDIAWEDHFNALLAQIDSHSTIPACPDYPWE